MNFNEQIQNWYKDLQHVSKDDKADFEVMLLDKQHPEDALSALSGMLFNLVFTGYKEDLLLLLIDATREDAASLVRRNALVELLQVCVLHDHEIRRSRDIQEALLEMLSQNQHQALLTLSLIHKVNNEVMHQTLKQKNVKETLIYELVVVGEEAHTLFENLEL